MSDQATTFFPLTGGLDLVTPAIVAKAGTVRNALNYEGDATGYRRADGFERFDGRTSPSEASWFLLNFDAGVAAINAGDTVTGATSGASGVALANAIVESGSYGLANADGYVALGAVTGTFTDNELLKVGGVTRAQMDGVAIAADSRTDAEAVAFQRQATANARALIQKVPGSGPVRGVWKYDGHVYAFRDNAGGTAGVMHKATTSGWVAQSFGRILPFTLGLAAGIAEGDTITGATSGATAVVRRVVLQGAGSFATNDQAGYLVLDTQAGSFGAESIKVAGTNRATIAGNSTAITLPAGGRYECLTHNFYGSADLERMYFANGVGFAHEWDGTVLCPIKTGMPVDAPTHIAEHKEALLLGFPSGSVEISIVGAPVDYRGTLGAVDLGIGCAVTGFIANVQGATIILGASKVAVLYGSDSNDYQLVTLNQEAGGVEWSGERMNTPLYMDARGIRKISASQDYGNFITGTVTAGVIGLIQNYVKRGATPTEAIRVRAKDQYRLFFNDTTGLTIFFGKKNPEIMPFQLPVQVRCACSYENAGTEELFAGADDGYVYQLDKGYSFDGASVPYYLRLPYNHLGAPRQKKRWHKCVIECDSAAPTTLNVSADFDYGGGSDDGMAETALGLFGPGGGWNLVNWNEFFWSSPDATEAEADLNGVSKNISLLFAGEADDEPPHLLQGVTIYYTVRGLER